MTGQHVAASLIEGVRTASEGLALRHTATIGGIRCLVLLPQQPPPDEPVFRLAPPAPPSGQHSEPGPGWLQTDWGNILIIKGLPAVTIRAVGLIPAVVIPPGSQHVAFDHAVAGWKQRVQDWLAVTAEGLTDSAGFYAGATYWGSPEYDNELFREPHQAGHRDDPNPSSPWAWTHALDHATAGDQPPLARTLMTTATRAAAAASWRVAIIDAATATEVALTTGLTSRLSVTLSPGDVQRELDRNRMLGRRIALAGSLGMVLPARIQDDLVDHRNAVVHQGTSATGSDASAAIAAAWKVVDQYEPLAPHCQEPPPAD
jgi:hypothetical protein